MNFKKFLSMKEFFVDFLRKFLCYRIWVSLWILENTREGEVAGEKSQQSNTIMNWDLNMRPEQEGMDAEIAHAKISFDSGQVSDFFDKNHLVRRIGWVTALGSNAVFCVAGVYAISLLFYPQAGFSLFSLSLLFPFALLLFSNITIFLLKLDGSSIFTKVVFLRVPECLRFQNLWVRPKLQWHCKERDWRHSWHRRIEQLLNRDYVAMMICWRQKCVTRQDSLQPWFQEQTQ